MFELKRIHDLTSTGLTNNEATSYPGNLEELSTSFRVVKSQLDESSTKEDSIDNAKN